MVLACVMGLAAVGGIAARPATKTHDAAPRYVLETMVPRQFGDWRELPQQRVQVVNPQTQQLLDKLYSQILTRVYVNSEGYRVMVSVAYGEDQGGRGDLQAHKPEVCYPAQGFKLLSNEPGDLHTPYGDIAARRLNTALGQRKEPITYWFTVGDTTVKNKLEQRMVEMRLGLTGQLPDGLLFRVSSLDDTPDRAYQAHQAFVVALLGALPAADRTRLSGLTS